MKRHRIAVSIALLVAGVLAVPATAYAGSPPPHDAKRASAAPTYQNPLDLQLPSGEQAASCVDPDIIRGQAEGDTNWYLYCTTDALAEDERDEAGNLLFYNIPMFQSTGLIHWTYVRDA